MTCPGAEFAGGTGCPSRLCQEGKRKLTESAKEFPKASAWQSPKGPFREALERKGMPPRHLLFCSASSRHPSSSPFISRCPSTCARSGSKKGTWPFPLILLSVGVPRAEGQPWRLSVHHTDSGALSGFANMTGGARYPPRLSWEGKLELTKAPRSRDCSGGNSRRLPPDEARADRSGRSVNETRRHPSPAPFPHEKSCP